MNKIKYFLASTLLVISAGCSTVQVSTPDPTISPTPSVSPIPSPVDTESTGKKLAVSKIVSGTSYGMCIGYCINEVTFEPTTLTVYKSATRSGKEQYPDVTKQSSLPQTDWDSLYTIIDTEKFKESKETIGCPDCADGGAEFIEITTPNFTKKITFEAGKTIDGMDKFVEQVRALRVKYLEQVK